jgi:hypothetical protein
VQGFVLFGNLAKNEEEIPGIKIICPIVTIPGHSPRVRILKLNEEGKYTQVVAGEFISRIDEKDYYYIGYRIKEEWHILSGGKIWL